MTYVGIDPGKEGGICSIYYGTGDECEAEISSFPMPLNIGNEIDIPKLSNILQSYAQVGCICALEDVHSIHGTASTANFQFGRSLGIVEGILGALKIPFIKVAPKKWQSLCHQGVPKLPDTKKMSAIAVQRLYPNKSFLQSTKHRVPHNGMVDACLICHYLKFFYNA